MADQLKLEGGQAWLSCLPRVVRQMSHWKGQVRPPRPQQAGPWQQDDFIVSGKSISSGSLFSPCIPKEYINSFIHCLVKDSVNRTEGQALESV